MYKKIILALDGSTCSDYAIDASIKLAEKDKEIELVGCHVYASNMHRTRFQEMEPGLPESYQNEERLTYLRGTHENLISNGMQLISDAYLSPFITLCNQKNINCSGLTPEGKHYVEFLKCVKKYNTDLVLVGVHGLGFIPDQLIGSFAHRILHHNIDCDTLIVKEPLNFKNRPIIVGIDGSDYSFAALQRAIEISKLYNTKVFAVACYDPFFHTDVFKTISDVLPKEQQKKFNFVAQEKLHDEIIDKGLEKLYLEGLKRGELLALSLDSTIKTEIITGKTYSKILHFAALKNACLIVIGRWGLHKEEGVLIGSNSQNVVLLSKINVLIVNTLTEGIKIPKILKKDATPLIWSEEAKKLTGKIPEFVRNMAIKMIEDYAREKGFTEVTPDLVETISNKFKMHN